MKKNKMKLRVNTNGENENFVRNTISAFALSLNPTVDEITDIKTAVSEAITNAIVHAYPEKSNDEKILNIHSDSKEFENENIIDIYAETFDNTLIVKITDYGISIDDIEKAKSPFFTTKGEDERSGMGFTVMESFMDEIIVNRGENGSGLVVYMKKMIGEEKKAEMEG